MYLKKVLLFLLIVFLSGGCGSQKKYYTELQDRSISVTRRYIGNFIDYQHTDPQVFAGADLIWIRTTQFNSFGKISAYGKVCKFQPGEKIYIKRMYSAPGIYGNWEYQIENDSSVVYRMSNFRYENNVLVQAVF